MNEPLAPLVCSACGKEYPALRSNGYDLRRNVCADRSACVRRSLQTAVRKPFVGFDPDSAYKSAPKIGDAA